MRDLHFNLMVSSYNYHHAITAAIIGVYNDISMINAQCNLIVNSWSRHQQECVVRERERETLMTKCAMGKPGFMYV